MVTGSDEWVEYRRLVLSLLSTNEERIEKVEASVAAIKIDLKLLQWKVGATAAAVGSATGLVVGIVASLVINWLTS